jgi:hypothetical protein
LGARFTKGVAWVAVINNVIRVLMMWRNGLYSNFLPKRDTSSTPSSSSDVSVSRYPVEESFLAFFRILYVTI